MKAMDLALALGQVDEELLAQGEARTVRRRPALWRRLAAAALAAAVMAGCFVLGALAAENGEGEIIRLPAAGITLQLPDSWKGRYVAVAGEDGMSCQVYVKSLYDQSPGWGQLFSAGRYVSQPMTPEEVERGSPVPARYLLSTQSGTYVLFYASDLQYDPNDPAQTAEYRQMVQEISQIGVRADYVLYNSAQSCLRTLRPADITGIEGSDISPEELVSALNHAVASPAAGPEDGDSEPSVILWLAGGSGSQDENDLRLELSAEKDGLVRVRYAGTGVFPSENPDVPGVYLHDYDQTLWLQDQALLRLLTGSGWKALVGSFR